MSSWGLLGAYVFAHGKLLPSSAAGGSAHQTLKWQILFVDGRHASALGALGSYRCLARQE
jgi:hypothetical protein